ncbi:Small-conductance mechanosensitive channel [Buchnera aphidicola (Neophyllaphis podocarpi)]|uniref:small-conductance mechanosensitive channel MscS n=1 Tax=Buchnera aphidicola TaxID=9 RepID=UPI003463896D
MEKFNLIYDIYHINDWVTINRELLIHYIINIIWAIAIFIIGKSIAKIISNGINKVLILRNIDITISNFISSIMRYSIITFTVIASLSKIGVQTTSIIAVLGTAGMAIGLALQGSLSNLSAGIILVTLRTLRTGEYVDLGGILGTILNVHIFYTILKTVDGKIAVIPNSKIINGSIINYSREPIRRNEFIIVVSYNSDIDLVKKIIQKVINEENRVIKDKDIIIGIKKIDLEAIYFTIRCWSKIDEYNSVYWDLMSKFKKSLDKNNININCNKININVFL